MNEIKKSFIEIVLNEHKTPEASIQFLQKQTELHPVDSRIDLQVFLNAMGKEEDSFAVSQKLMELAPRDFRVLFNHGWHLLKRGKLNEGMRYLEYGRPLNTYGHPPLQSIRNIWSPVNGKDQVVIFVCEGGFGDELIHLRFAKDLHEKYNCKIIVSCHPKLAEFLVHQPYISAVIQREAALGVYHDSWVPGMSAALCLNYEYKDISAKPYLQAHPKYLDKWKNKIKSDKFKIGIRWAGSPQFEHQQLRSFSPHLLVDLYKKFPKVQFYSFQRDNNLVNLPIEIVDLQNEITSWDDTAAALMQMDLVISSCTSVAHMSAAMGQKTWVIVPALPYFIWAYPGNTSPWYESVRLFRQVQYGDWLPTFESLEAELRKI